MEERDDFIEEKKNEKKEENENIIEKSNEQFNDKITEENKNNEIIKEENNIMDDKEIKESKIIELNEDNKIINEIEEDINDENGLNNEGNLIINEEINKLEKNNENKNIKNNNDDDKEEEDGEEKDNLIINKNIQKEENNIIEKDDNNIININNEDKNEIEEPKKENKEKDIGFQFEILNEKELFDKKDDSNLNQKEINKLKEIFLNLFTVKSKSNPDDTKKKEKKLYNNFEVFNIDDDEIIENTSQIEPNKGKIYTEIIKCKEELGIKKKLNKFNLFHHEIKNVNDNKTAYRLGKVLVYTYRKNFPKIKSFKTKKNYTTDAWWGCMVRCGQMILSRGIYRILKSKKLDTKTALYYTVPLFGNYPIKKEQLHPFFQGMIKKYNEMENINENSDNQIEEFFPPFSIRTLCDVGELFERTAGEWFSDVIITGVFKKISIYFELFNSPDFNLKILTYQSCIEIQDVLDNCFVQKKYDPKNKEYIKFNDKYYYFEKMGIIFVNVRVGLDKIPKEYFPGIRQLLNFKECIGIIGGKTRLAYYFIGYDIETDSLLYLDPHVTKEADKLINMGNILQKHVNKEIHLLKMNKMSTAFTIGFCFRNYDEFLKMYELWLKVKHNDLPILGLNKQRSIQFNNKEAFEDEDFSPTYVDQDEDDF